MEMLVVMGIIAVLLATVVPAMRGLSGAANRQGAAGTLLGVLDRARMMAISDGLATYVVFAVPGGDGANLKKELWGRAYAIYQDHDNISFKAEQRTPWMQLPQGLAFKIDGAEGIGGDRATTITNRVLQSSDPSFPVTVAVLSTGGATSVRLPYWKFDGTGVVDEQDPYLLRLLIFSGFIDMGGSEVALKNSGGTSSKTNKLMLQEITVNPATGRARYTANPYNMSAPTPTPASTPST